MIWGLNLKTYANIKSVKDCELLTCTHYSYKKCRLAAEVSSYSLKIKHSSTTTKSEPENDCDKLWQVLLCLSKYLESKVSWKLYSIKKYRSRFKSRNTFSSFREKKYTPSLSPLKRTEKTTATLRSFFDIFYKKPCIEKSYIVLSSFYQQSQKQTYSSENEHFYRKTTLKEDTRNPVWGDRRNWRGKKTTKLKCNLIVKTALKRKRHKVLRKTSQ